MQLDSSKTWHPTAAPWADSDARDKSKVPTNYVVALNDEPIGGIGLTFKNDVECRTVEFGYWIGREHWGKGITSVVAKAFLEWTWETFPWVVRVVLKAYAWNQASIRIAEKLGMEREVVMKAAVWKDGKVGDMVCFAKIRDGLEY
jgi:[ribosomal protein S5]-alanine N-acetyltransferase